MNKYVDPEKLKNEIAKAPVWTSLTIIEIINKMTEPTTQMKAQNSNLTFEKVDKPQGYWTKTDVATYRCSECGKIQIADDVNELNYCCCCGSRNKVRRYERSRR